MIMKKVLIAVSLLVASIAQAATVAYWDFELDQDGNVPADGQPFTAAGAPDGSGGAFDQSGNGHLLRGFDVNQGSYFTSDTIDGSLFSAACSDDPFQDAYVGMYLGVVDLLNDWSPITWTIEASAKINDLEAAGGYQTIVGRDGTNFAKPEADFYLQKIWVGTDHYWRLLFWTVGGQQVEITATGINIVEGAWYGVAAVSDGYNAYLYIDDCDGNGYELEGSAPLTGSWSDNALSNGNARFPYNYWTVGRGFFNNTLTDHVEGVIDNVRFSDVALLPSELIPVGGTAPDVTILEPASGHLAPVNEAVEFSGSFTDGESTAGSTAEWIISQTGKADIVISGTITGDSDVEDEFSFPEPGIYTITLAVTDSCGNVGEATTVFDANTSSEAPAYIVVYNPTGGYVTGAGWIWSPAGAFHPGLAEFEPVDGMAIFGFVAEYKKGATMPTGQTAFRFHAGDLNFHSSNYQWLVVAGKRATFKGEGTINGEGTYGFMLTGIDGDLKGGDGNDRFRIKIWESISGVIVYDNQAGAVDDADLDDSTIVHGNIVVHN